MSKTYTRDDAALAGYTTRDTTEQELTDARTTAMELLRDPAGATFRSCWVCNGAHTHMIEGTDTVLLCFVCGHSYLGGIDLTQDNYDE